MFKLKNNKEIILVFLDNSGSERSYYSNFNYLKAVTGIIVVINVTNKKSLDNIEQRILDIKDNLNNPIIIIFQNKSI